ncbi:MAG: RDD family protein [Gemmatimonadota bacterium]|nr:MAG: RDD family protein [Gemmatimonadota bacterium]
MEAQNTATQEEQAQTDSAADNQPRAKAGKADLGKRFVAAVIDAVIAIVLGLVPAIGGLAAAAYWLVRDGLELQFMDRRSVGKRLMQLRPVTLDGSPMDLVASAKRNWMFAIGGIVTLLLAVPFVGLLLVVPVAIVGMVIGILELFLVLGDPEGRRLGDKIANTKVVDTIE